MADGSGTDFGAVLRARAAARANGAGDWSVAARHRAEVSPSAELERICRLPRRAPYTEGGDYDAPVAKWTSQLRTPGSVATLRPIQAFAFDDAASAGGLYLAAGVGRGKTLISVLLPTVLKSTRSLLFIPAAAREQFFHISYPALARDWQVPPLAGAGATAGLKVVTYQEWSAKGGQNVLSDWAPDLIIGDEVHELFNYTTVRYRRLRDYYRKTPSARFACMTGSPTKDTIKNFSVPLALALRGQSPVPRQYYPLEEWSLALDPIKEPIRPGALARLWGAPTTRDYTVEEAREGFRRRLVETPGVVATTVAVLPIRLVLRTRPVVVPAEAKKALSDFRKTWSLPGGDEITEALEFHRHARELACGFFYKWDPAPTAEWLEARRAWHGEVRSFLRAGGRPGLDSPGLLEDAARDGRRPSAAYDAWAAVRSTCAPKTVPTWVSDYLVQDAVAWARSHRGIVWYEHDAVGDALRAAAPELPYFGPGDAGILYADGSTSVIASRKAHFQSKELHAFHEQLVISPPSSGAIWEQLLGRTYRDRQTSSVITTWVYQHTPEVKRALKDALQDAKYASEVHGLDQLLLRAERAEVDEDQEDN